MKTTIVDFSEIKANKIWRLEAEFFNQKSLAGSNFIPCENAIPFVQYGTSEELNDSGYGFPVLRLNEFDGLFIKTPKKYCNKINLETFERLSLKKDDILICRTNGNPKLVGKSSIVPQDYNFAFASYLFRVRLKKDIINPATLVIYLNSRIGRSEIEKYLMISNQANFSPAKFKEIQIPILSESIQKLIEKIVYFSYQKHESANSDYIAAEQILLSELNLISWKPQHKSFFIKNFSDTQYLKRIDAEYFQPMYEEVVDRIKQYKKGFMPLDEIVKVKSTIFQPKDDMTYRYIELANISTNGNIIGFLEAMGKELPTRARRKVNAGDVIVSTIEGSLSNIALITSELDNALCSTGFFVVNSEKLNSETLLVLLKSVVGQLQLKKGCSGTILTAIGEDEFKRIVLPKLHKRIQNQIKTRIAEMYSAKALSTAIIDIAKRGVEMVIDKSDKDAQNWIYSELIKLGVRF